MYGYIICRAGLLSLFEKGETFALSHSDDKVFILNVQVVSVN